MKEDNKEEMRKKVSNNIKIALEIINKHREDVEKKEKKENKRSKSEYWEEER